MGTNGDGYTVGTVAQLANVSVRTLHHYDELGLIEPSRRSDAGYRLYTDTDLERLQQVLFYRELGLPLEEIGRVMNEPGFDRREALCVQRDALAAQAERAKALLDAVDLAIDALDEGVTMTKEEMFEVFGDDHKPEYEQEAKERWGDTDAYKESARRTKRYTKADWERIKAEGDEVEHELARLFAAGHEPGDPAVQAVIERKRLQIDQWFYPCTPQMHAYLGQMYVTDARFTEHYDRLEEGLAQFVCDATQIAADR